jgi:hypothetical protein
VTAVGIFIPLFFTFFNLRSLYITFSVIILLSANIILLLKIYECQEILAAKAAVAQEADSPDPNHQHGIAGKNLHDPNPPDVEGNPDHIRSIPQWVKWWSHRENQS